MVKITFIDNESVLINDETVITGYNNVISDDKEYYIEIVFCNSFNGLTKEPSKLATSDRRLGVMGLILSVDCFSIGIGSEKDVLYLPSAVKSIENV